jgi:hypothetical protein
MIIYELGIDSYIINEAPIIGGPEGYKLELKKAGYKKPVGFTLYKNNKILLDMTTHKLILLNQEFEGAKDNGDHTGVTHHYFNSSMQIKIEKLPLWQFFFTKEYLLGYINNRRMFITRKIKGGMIRYSCSSLIIDIFNSKEAPIIFAFFSAYMMFRSDYRDV